jgi:hypothetical protein
LDYCPAIRRPKEPSVNENAPPHSCLLAVTYLDPLHWKCESTRENSVYTQNPSMSEIGMRLLKNSIFFKTAEIWGIEDV